MPVHIRSDAEKKQSEEVREKILAEQKWKRGDVVTTINEVIIRSIGGGKSPGKALPGWRWRIVEVLVNPVSGRTTFEVVADDAPTMYRQTFRDKQIAKVVGKHHDESDLLSKRVK